ncbi:outer membrane beta-barrel protein [Maritalea mobilis]|uniref:outer membrane protein n=1 Tax=Maritalea mobilis TaxID=483324 RepID=UPI001C952FFD|nr:outer membrane beta-barrel protein [Maritalea mobilis]MBY6200242.1 outer membrane beta-barrel protein [Maritalea mobilis]
MKSVQLVKLSAAALLASTCATFAGGVVETPPPPVTIIPEPIYDWTGVYVGGSLSFGHGIYEGEFVPPATTDFPGDGEGDIDGHMISGLIGYNMQNGNLVYGAEVALSAVDIDGSEPCPNTSFDCNIAIDSMVSLSGRLGYLMNDQMMVYGSLGLAAANVEVSTIGLANDGSEETATGFTIGVGMEYAVSESMRVRGGITHYAFGEEEYGVSGGDVAEVDFNFTTVEIGVLFQF